MRACLNTINRTRSWPWLFEDMGRIGLATQDAEPERSDTVDGPLSLRAVAFFEVWGRQESMWRSIAVARAPLEWMWRYAEG